DPGVEVVEVQAPEALDGGRDVALDGGLVGDVGLHRERLAGERGGDLLGTLAVEVDDDDRGAGGREPPRRRRPQAARAAGDDGDLALHPPTVASTQAAIGSSASTLLRSSIIAWPLPWTPASSSLRLWTSQPQACRYSTIASW